LVNHQVSSLNFLKIKLFSSKEKSNHFSFISNISLYKNCTSATFQLSNLRSNFISLYQLIFLGFSKGFLVESIIETCVICSLPLIFFINSTTELIVSKIQVLIILALVKSHNLEKSHV
jgi:hypothetical protein